MMVPCHDAAVVALARSDGVAEAEVMVSLSAHPSTPEGGWQVSAEAERTATGVLRLRYLLRGARGALAAVGLPPPGIVRRGDRLWEHTCMEAFIAAEGEHAYVEINLSPSCAWAAYAFSSYREGGPLGGRLEPEIMVQREPDS